MTISEIRAELTAASDVQRAKALQKFFQTGEGQYGAGDLFRGIPVPVLRKFAKQHQSLNILHTEQLLGSSFHEDRLLALLILVRTYERGDEYTKAIIYDLYLRNTEFINNWDLVDSSAPHIVGRHLHTRSRKPLYSLAQSKSLWERRISVLATAYFIKHGEFDETLHLATLLLADREDLIHKAVGWMLREIGKRDLRAETDFLRAHYRRMPRVMLRYAIERLPPTERLKYLRGEV